MTRLGWVCISLLSLGAEPTSPPSVARLTWEAGQRAILAGQTDRAIALYQQSLRLDPGLIDNELSLAAAYLDKGQDEQAVGHLARYVEARPDHFVIRAHYAELLLQLHRPTEARSQFERFIADVQDRDDLARQHLVHCHSRLMEIAQGEEDEYGEHLHRGIGLYLLACRRAQMPEPGGALSVEELLFRAAAELTQARLRQPEEARPYWYLYLVWSRLAQHQPAARWLRSARDAALLSRLTPAERRDLHLAGLLRRAENSR